MTKTRKVPPKPFRVVNPEQPQQPQQPQQQQQIPWKLLLLTTGFSTLAALIIGDIYRGAKDRLKNAGSQQHAYPPMPGGPYPISQQPVTDRAANFMPPARWSMPGHTEPQERYESNPHEEDMWDQEEIEQKIRKLNRKEKELANREAEIEEQARRLRLIS